MMDIFKKHVCDRCGTKFWRVEALMQHLQVIHGKGLLYECKPCNAKFDGMEQMRDHLKKFHSYNKRGISEKKRT
jgi:DNA-directed RNA polymerase subunit RPC12/RpoP